jgi:pimeloyl-ACP methyl ester carboxylesterase
LETTITSLPEGEIRLRDGRRLAYAEYGDSQGKPIFFFHGTPGSRLFHHPDTSVAASAGARVIAIDRPGFGRSDFKPDRTLLDWPSDIVQLADALNIQRFAVMGYSGGGPYAAVCASSISDRLTAAGLVSSIAPLDSPEITRGMHGMGHMFFSLERHLPPLAKLSCRLICATWRSNPDLYFKAQLNGLYDSREAQALLPVMKAMLTADLLEAVRDGTHGITCDLEILAKPWGFQLHVIPTNVFLWHGENDTQAPVAMGKRLAGGIPHCRATFFPGEGHWAIYSHWQEILTALAQAEATTREEPQSAAMAADQDIIPRSETVVLPGVLDIVDTPADSAQGLQPAREAAEAIPAKAMRETGTIAEESPASIPRETEPVLKAPKPGSKKTAKDRTAAIADSPSKASGKLKPAPEKAKAATAKTAKRAAAVTAGAPTHGAAKHKPLSDKAKASAKRSAKPKPAFVEPPSAVVSKESHPAPEPPEPLSAKPSSRRRAAKEAVLV